MSKIILNYRPANKNYKTFKICDLSKKDFNGTLYHKVLLFLRKLTPAHLSGETCPNELFKSLEGEINSEDLEQDKITAQEFYRLQSKYLRAIKENRIEWKIKSLTRFTDIESGFFDEKMTKDEVNSIINQGLVLEIVNHVDFCYLGPLSSIEDKTTQKFNKVLTSKEFKSWLIPCHVEFSNYPNKDKDPTSSTPGCFYKQTNFKPPLTNLRVFLKDGEEKRILENYRAYFPANLDTIKPPNSKQYSGLFITLPYSKKNFEFGNVDPSSIKTAKYHINPSVFGPFNPESSVFENKHLELISVEDYKDYFIYSDVGNLDKFMSCCGDSKIDIDNVKINNDLSTPDKIMETEKHLCSILSNQYIFKDIEKFFYSNTFETNSRTKILVDKNYQLSTSKNNKPSILKNYLLQLYQHDRSMITYHQANFVAFLKLSYISLERIDKDKTQHPPQLNFELDSIACLGTTCFPYSNVN